MADAPSLEVTPASGDEDTAIALDITPALTDTDGSETLAIEISGVPAGATLSAGTDQGGGVWLLAPGDLTGLTITPPVDSDADFQLTVTARSTEGANGDVVESVTTLDVTVDAVADAPSLEVTPASGDEDTAIALDITPALTDTDGSETLAIEISGVPAGATLSAGADQGGGVWLLAPGDLTGLTITPPADSDADFTLTVTARSTEGANGDVAESVTTLDVTVDAVADAPSLAVQAASGDEDTAIALDITSALADTDGSETLAIEISGVPAGATLSVGADQGGGVWLLAPADLTGLTITPPADSDADFTLTVTARSTEGANGDVAETATTLAVTVDAVADAPSLAVSPASGDEDTAIALDITSALADTDGSETLAIEISGVPAGATLSAGSDQGGGVWLLTPADLTGLTITPPADSDADFTLTVTARSSETANGDVSETVTTLDVTVLPVNDAPEAVGGLMAVNPSTTVNGRIVATDRDGDLLTFTLDEDASHGSVTVNPDGTYSYMANAGFSGEDSFTVLVSDGNGGFDTATVDVVVAAGGEGQVRYLSDIFIDEQVSENQNSYRPEVAMLSDGGHIVVWEGYNYAIDPSGLAVFAQRYDADGEKLGDQVLVNTTTASNQRFPSVAGLTGGTHDGGFVVVWQSFDQVSASSQWDIVAQRFAADGSRIGGEIVISSTANSQNDTEPTVTALAGGNWAVTWYDATVRDIKLRVYDEDGSALTGELTVNQGTAQAYPDGSVAETIATLDDGGFVVTWRHYDGNDINERSDAYARVYNADGTARTGEFQVNTTTLYDQVYVSVGALQGEDAGFVVTWRDYDGSNYDIYARRYDKDGNAIDGSDFLVSRFAAANYDDTPKAIGLSDGGFVVIWRGDNYDGSGASIIGQRYAADGSEVGEEFVVNADTVLAQYHPSIDLRADGALVVVWEANGNRIEQAIITDFEADTRAVSDILLDEQVSENQNSYRPEVAMLSDGGHIVVWEGYNYAIDPSGMGVFAQRYDADGEKLGDQFLVNTTTTSDQRYPSVAGLTGGTHDGGFVVVWQGINQASTSSGWDIVAQRFAADGSRIGGEIVISATGNSQQDYEPTVTALADGNWAVTWYDGTSGQNIRLRIYDEDGNALTGELTVNETAGSAYNEGYIAETIATLDDGGFVVTWRRYDGNDINERSDAYARVYNADGTARTGEFQVNTTTLYDQNFVSVGALQGEDAGFVVTWRDYDGNNYDIYARRYDKDGNAIDGSDFLVSRFAAANYDDTPKAIGLSDGGFVVIWRGDNYDGSGASIIGQRYAADGSEVGEEFVVNAENSLAQYHPSIDLRADGALVVVWEANGNRIEQKIITDFEADTRAVSDIFLDEQVSENQNSYRPEVAMLSGGGHIVVWDGFNSAEDNSGSGVFAQIYDASGEKLGDQFLVNTTTALDQRYPSVAGLTGGTYDGGFVVVWQGNNQASNISYWDIVAQRFAADGSKIGGEIVISPTTNYQQDYEPTVTALADGNWAVTWYDGSAGDIKLRVYDEDGSALTGELTVNQGTAQAYPDGSVAETIATLDDGGFVVSWRHYDGNDVNEWWDAYARVYNADGTARTGEFQVNTTTPWDQIYVSVGALQGEDAGFVVTWRDYDGSNYDIYARRYDKDGNAIDGADVLVSSLAGNYDDTPKAIGLSDGGFVVIWRGNNYDGSGASIIGQRYAADGSEVGGEFVVNADNSINQYEPSIDLRADGALVVVWRADGNRIEQKIITDFEAGAVDAKDITGTAGNDVLIGSTLADRLAGADGDDVIEGGAGEDLIDGGAGFDLLTGGEDADTFVLRLGDGSQDAGTADRITDFEDGVDLLALADGLTFGDLVISDGGTANTTISDATTGEILAVVEDVDELQITVDDFVFLYV
ncbi:MAG: Ig-like domain-containing protein [Rhodobacteraceae bacterium]|nr:Ig-like domain-containing protein [Paracoccaceae bacterium]